MNETNTPAAQPSKQNRTGKIIAIAILAILLLILALPSLLSTTPGKALLVKIINTQIPGSVTIKSISIGWFSGQYITDLELRDPQNQSVLSIQSLKIPDASLGSLISGSRNLGNIDIAYLRSNIIQQPTGQTNLDAAISSPKASTPKKPKSPSKDSTSNMLAGLSFALNVKDAQLTYNAPDLEPIILEIPTTQIDFKRPQDITINIQGSITQNQSAGKLDINANIQNLLDNNAQLTFTKTNLDVAAHLNDLPIDAIDRMANQQGKLIALIGPTLNSSLTANGNLDNMAIKLNTQSQHINASADIASNGSSITNATPAQLTLDITPEAWRIITRDQTGQNNSTLEKPFTITLALDKLNLPIVNSKPNLQNAQTDLKLDISQIMLHTPNVGEIDLRRTVATLQSDHLATSLAANLNSVAMLNKNRGEINLTANINDWLAPDNTFATNQYTSDVKLAVNQFPLAAILDDLLNSSDLYMQALGATIDSALIANYSGQKQEGMLNLQLTTAHGNATMDAVVSPNNIQLTQDTIVNYRIQPNLLAAALNSDDYKLASPANLILSVEQFKIDTQSQSITPNDITTGLTLRLDNLSFVQGNYQNLNLQNSTIYIHPNTNLGDKDIPIQLAAKLQNQQQSASITGNIHTYFPGEKWQTPAFHKSTITLKDIPPAIFDSLIGASNSMATLIGPSIDNITITAEGDLNKRFTLNTSVTSPNLTADIDGQLDTVDNQQIIDIKSNSNIKFTLTPQTYAAYTAAQNKNTNPANRLNLLKPTTLTLNLTDGSLPLSMNPKQTKLKANLTSTEFAVQRGSDTQFFIRNLAATADAQDLTQPTTLNITADILQQSANKKSSTGKIRSKTTLTNVVDSQGKINTENLNLNFDSQIQSMPIDLLDQLGRYNGSLIALVGSTANLTLTGDFPGNIDLKIDSQTLDVPAYVHVTRDYILTLRQDFDAQLKPTPQTFSTLLAKAQPVLADAINSERPIRLLVKKERFALPLTNFQTQTLNMDGTLDLGAIQMKRQGWLMQGMGNVIGRLGIGLTSQRNEAQSYTATFTPMDITINNGLVEPSQVWMTSEDLAVGFQVRANLNNQRLNAFMGIMGASFIAQSPLLSQSFNADQVYNVPISGSINNPNIDWNFLYLNIVGTTGTKAIAENTGDLGRTLGGLIGGIGQNMNEDKLRKAGLKAWNPPPPAIALAKNYESSSNASSDQQPQQSPQEQPRNRDQRSNPVNDLLDIFR
ncbi:hypothetical protein KS4_25510 [Poriferisphaera corsica]|uniref:Uncharacterized protein n=1 Tax=Poriferisphaera corsica TaxID=2528020 RepID=A0A517YW74_9BACT|nr:hypothetical protein [Poriferisphaera corsica]QDU34481.1 hypothetical protein KS4_25510 [Poriferisphaera corsica]